MPLAFQHGVVTSTPKTAKLCLVKALHSNFAISLLGCRLVMEIHCIISAGSTEAGLMTSFSVTTLLKGVSAPLRGAGINIKRVDGYQNDTTAGLHIICGSSYSKMFKMFN